ncbi:hypothetical protein [Vibrio sp. TBV020]|uniref:hypothetical protein n=1 Tax=Vibrio sp. TBV020 TaxID=3137398 RepID=UPI0038CD3AFA
MKAIPMLFQTELIRALLEGRKTVTRRPVDKKKHEFIRFMGSSDKECSNLEFLGLNYAKWKDDNDKVRGPEYLVYCTEYPEEGIVPIGQGPAQKGDLIYVRETFMADPDTDHDSWNDHELSYFEWAGCDSSPQFLPDALKTTEHCIYKANGPIDGKWIPSIHMPRWASRLTLKVTDVRIEQLKDITEEQAKNEGMAPGFTNEFGKCPVVPNYRDGFFRTWNNIYNNWDQNPYVWVIEFEVIHKNVDLVISEMEASNETK